MVRAPYAQPGSQSLCLSARSSVGLSSIRPSFRLSSHLSLSVSPFLLSPVRAASVPHGDGAGEQRCACRRRDTLLAGGLARPDIEWTLRLCRVDRPWMIRPSVHRPTRAPCVAGPLSAARPQMARAAPANYVIAVMCAPSQPRLLRGPSPWALDLRRARGAWRVQLDARAHRPEGARPCGEK